MALNKNINKKYSGNKIIHIIKVEKYLSKIGKCACIRSFVIIFIKLSLWSRCV